METTFIKNEQYTHSQISVSVHSDRQIRWSSTRENMDKPTPTKTEHAWLACTLLLIIAIPRPAQSLSNGTGWRFTPTVQLPILILSSYVHSVRVRAGVKAVNAYIAWWLGSEDQTPNTLNLCLRRMFYLLCITSARFVLGSFKISKLHFNKTVNHN